jgi:hypothetical protein
MAATVLLQASYFLKTTHEISLGSYSSTTYHPIH